MRVSVIIPVHNDASLVDRCLESVVPQVAALDGEVVVVDDGSTDATADLASQGGARVLRLATQRGPYAARNEGWRSSDAEELVFTDVRCRARPGWLDALLTRLATPGIAIVGADVWVAPGSTTASRAAAHAQPLLASRSVNDRYLPFVATCSLATTRPFLAAVGGFVEVRGGADVDFCWRVQEAGLGEVRLAKDAAMDWVARAGTADLLRQYHRYGRNTRWLQEAHADRGCPVDPDVSRWRTWGAAGRDLLQQLPDAPPRRWPELAVVAACRVAAAEGHRTAP